MNDQIYILFVNRKDLLLNALTHMGHFAAQTVILDNLPAQALDILFKL